VIGFIVISKLPKLKTLDVKTVSEAVEEEAKKKILKQRMQRQTKKGGEAVKKAVFPILQRLKKTFSGYLKKIKDLERKYEKEAEGRQKLNPADSKRKIEILLKQAEKSFKKQKIAQAEKEFIEVISLQPNNVKAYEGLTKVYLEQKEYDQALQTQGFVLKLAKKKSELVEGTNDKGLVYKTYSNADDLSDAFYDYARILYLKDSKEKALENFQKALEIQPNNPRNLAQVIELSIELKNKILALDTLKELERVNPENQKLKEYNEKIAAL